MAIMKPLEELLNFLDDRVFRPTAGVDPLAYATPEDRKLLKSVQKRVQDTKVRYFADYGTPQQVKANFVQDLNSKPGQALASDMWLLHLTRFENIREEFFDLCRKVGL